MLVLPLVITGCDTSPDPTTTVVATPTTTIRLGEPTEPQVYEMLAVVSHPNGMQVKVDRVELLENSVVVSGSVTNGSPYGISVDAGTTELITDTGEVASLIEGLPDGPISPGEELELALRFAPVVDPSAVTLVLNSGEGSSTVSPSTASPSVLLGPVPLDSRGLQAGPARACPASALGHLAHRRRAAGRRHELHREPDRRLGPRCESGPVRCSHRTHLRPEPDR